MANTVMMAIRRLALQIAVNFAWFGFLTDNVRDDSVLYHAHTDRAWHWSVDGRPGNDGLSGIRVCLVAGVEACQVHGSVQHVFSGCG